MATTYNISITDLKVIISINNSVKTYARDKHKASISGNTIKIINIATSEDVEYFNDISFITSIIDYRNGNVVPITVPPTLLELYNDVIEDIEAPFFFESFKADAVSPVEVSVKVGYDSRDIVYLSPVAKGLVDYISYKKDAIEVRRETLSYDGNDNIINITIT